ncbi:putative MarR family transcription regulator [Rhodobium orientis]|uniref:Transcriptional regulator n=1 Tax=Rhodobium orientis TaxID=34017 RepID=A0A327JPF5_9HYPH|nr:winged helix DNA-binding protein [Rhodobium orientis]MBB4305481.1 putative MarR family transcription regulator [Rhodobium orientis]MBK5948677.1 transcriptional regulator [Rhodobium orientis]RAI25298.1 transcriptional regulator [Rhodobium orientis]
MAKAENTTGNTRRVGPVVSSAHLAAGSAPALSELEFALTMSNNAFHRWMVRCMSAAGHPGLGPLDILVLHIVNHRDRVKTLADLCLVLNIEDTHTVVYAIRKLEAAGLVASGKRGKEKTVAITEEGAGACAAYRDIREALLADAVASIGFDQEEISKLATLLRALSGHYDQAARAAASL